jgi:hypothetical protein
MSSYVSSSVLGLARRRPVAASAAAIFAISTSTAWATPPPVTNCNDSGVGSLRYAVDPANGAVSGDTIDFSTLDDPGCAASGITLTTGAIVVSQQNLTIKGNGQRGISIAQFTPNSRVITHSYPAASGHLYLQDTKVNDGHITDTGQVNGGCVATLGSLTLNNVEVYECSATTTGLSSDVPAPHAFGGGVYAAAGLTISGHSLLDHNTVTAANNNVRAQGGCAETPGMFDMRDSIVAKCYANGARSRGGALELKGAVTITGSVIGFNYSRYIGGVDINSTAPGATTAIISNSSIAYNNATKLVGGLYAIAGHVNINNSTIVLNTAGSYTYTYNTKTYYAAPGVEVTSYNSTALSLQSTIIANNSVSNGTQVDLSTGVPFHSGTTITGSNNLVRAYLSDVTLPSGQGNLAKGTCPVLGHARNNGGNTYTFAPQSRSPLIVPSGVNPVIDAGNNTANDPHTGVPALYDQRGSGYPRVSNFIADIGAHEVQQADIVFNTEFETGCE